MSHAIKVTPVPRFLAEQSDPDAGCYAFAYTITLENTGTVTTKLISRHWLITDGDGKEQEVRGLGVVGEQPLLQPGESFQYTSGCPLRTPTGTMHGHYHCVGEDGEAFEVPIPLFLLEATGTGPTSAPLGARVLH